jgi:hypothetical protein
VLFGIEMMRCSLWTKMSATRAVGGQEDIVVVRVLLECVAGARRWSVWWIEGVRWVLSSSKSVVRSDRELAAMTKTPNLSLNLAADP